ncbi:hypothetical protein [Motilimonas sp. E26]|uniref:hypothetical protein n=1 Tax=Motilimonas sp. E26 TaxID=2865674 RepID=UPI001E4DBB13|nr:hypothetical protein [Motilimonas sp. E26]MCE0558417.1 hypothetical protein [Motilimonas sp. E26]
MTLNEIYQAETCPPKTQWLPELIAASREKIDNFVASENTQGWFLNGVFHHRVDNDDKVYQSIFQHPNCPPRLIAIAQRFKPEWIVDSPAMALIQLGMLDPDGKKEWETTKSSLAHKELAMFIYSGLFQQERRYILNHYTYDKDHFDEILVLCANRNRYQEYRQGLMRNLFALTPPFIFDAFAEEAKTPISLAAFQPIQALANRLAAMKVTELEFVAQRDDLTVEIQHFLASHRSVKIKKRLLENKWADETVLLQLAQDLNAKIAVMAKKKLSKERLSELNQALTTTALNNKLDDKALLDLLRIEAVSTQALLEIATTAEPLWCCAATLHKSATQEVFNAVWQREDLPNWAKIGIALHTQDAAQIDALIATGNKDLWFALSDNPNLSAAQAETLIVKSKDEVIWCGIANSFIDNHEVLNIILNQRGKKVLWQKHLKMLLDPDTSSKDVVKIQGKTNPHGIVFSRLMARHARCPINFIIRLAAYFPQDTKLNTKYVLKLQEDPESAQAEQYSTGKIENLLMTGEGYSFVYEWVLENLTDERDIRRCISVPRLNPNKVRHLAISADDQTLRRFVATSARKYSFYEYRMLATIGNATTLKSLIKSEYIDNDSLKELLEHNDSSVKTYALKLAKKRKLNVNTTTAVKKHPRQNSLGNKPERVELAKETSDLALLTILASDKTRDVREQVTNNKNVSPELLLLLVADKDDLITLYALKNLKELTLSKSENERLQQVIKDIFVDDNRAERLRVEAAKVIDDGILLASQFINGASDLDKIILAKSNCSEFLDKAFFAAQRGDVNIHYPSLASNKYLNPLHVNQLINSKDIQVRKNIACNQRLDNEQILRLCHDREFIVYNLASSEHLDLNCLPTWALCKAYHYTNWGTVRERVAQVLELRGIKSHKIIMTLPNLLKLFDLKMTVKNFNKKLLEKGLVEITNMAHHSVKPISRERFANEAYLYGHDSDVPENMFTPLYYPHSFAELLTLLEIEVKEPLS